MNSSKRKTLRKARQNSVIQKIRITVYLGINQKEFQPMKNGGIKASKVVYYVILSGITTGIGAFFGAVAGNISKGIIAICLSLAAGAMIYIVSGELVPESNKLYSGRTTALGSIIGLIIRNYSNVICIIIHK